MSRREPRFSAIHWAPWLAILLNRHFRGKAIIRAFILLPFIIPTVLSTFAWKWMFDPTFSVINWTLFQLGLITTRINWLGDPEIADGLAFDFAHAPVREYHFRLIEEYCHRYDFDAERGSVSNKQLWLRLAEGDGVPDGMTTDAQGRVWIAHWGGACVSCHHPETAQELGRVHLPTSHVTNCAFGGADLRTLYITSARTGLTPEQLAAEPLAGALFAVDISTPGLPAHLFGG